MLAVWSNDIGAGMLHAKLRMGESGMPMLPRCCSRRAPEGFEALERIKTRIRHQAPQLPPAARATSTAISRNVGASRLGSSVMPYLSVGQSAAED